MPFTGPAEDRLAIRELYGACADATMRQDREQYLACWSEDGMRIAADGECHGKEAIARHWDAVWATIAKMGFFTEIGMIEVAGPTATARVHCREIVHLKTGQLWKLVGRYDDSLEKQNGLWRFKRRAYDLFLPEAMPPAPAA